MKQGILITAYKNVDHLVRLIEAFDERFTLYLHIDKKSRDYTPSIIQDLLNKPNVVFISRRYAIKWGGVNHMKAILQLCREALKDTSLEYIHLITGHDFPIKSCSEITAYLEEHRGSEFLDYFDFPNSRWTDGGVNRIKYYNFYDFINSRKYQKRINQLIRLQQRLGLYRKLAPSFPKLYGGSTYWTLSWASLRYSLYYCDLHPEYLQRFKFTFCAEEFFFQTILLNSPFARSIINNNLRYIDWEPRNGNCPANLDNTDYQLLLNSEAFFARKFEFPVSKGLRDKIEKLIVSKG